MRFSKPIVAGGTLHTSAFGVRHAVIGLVAAVGLIWVGAAFAQEAFLSHKLTDQVANLRKQNAVLAGQNAGYHKDVAALKSGVANEEEARLNGYARPNEKLYLVTAPVSPSPSVTPSASPSPSPRPR
jgi:cell division protein FtsB